ncbi:MAG: hypothetical protein ACD_46C00155G0001 [uncultured bacterium]|nr:MAG: hypothetical protein ACD_46C00155G0001 [uncultured bacterium]
MQEANIFNLLWITVALGLVLLNAFFVAAEFGMVRMRHTQIDIIEATYGLRGKILVYIHHHLDSYLSACQLGITLASLGLGWIGEPVFARLLAPLFQLLGILSPQTIEFLAFFVAFTFLSFLHIVVGELMPKSLAIRQAEKVSIWTAIPLYGFYWLMFPAIWLLNSCSNFLLKMIKLNKMPKGERYYSTDEIKLILTSSHLHGELTKDEIRMIEHTLDFADLQVTDVMRPIDEMISLNINQPIDELLKIIIETRYTRYPILDKANGNIIGIIHVKDLFSHLYQHKTITSLTELMRPILKVSWHLPALELLRKFRSGVTHFAIIYRRVDAPIGFITFDNLLHILVGRVKDEFHKTKDDWDETDDGGIIVKGNCSIYTVERALDIDIFTEDEITTIYGLIIDKLGGLPKVGEGIEFDDFVAIVEEMKGTQILSVKIYPKK